jgi:hypothetical protein
LRVLRVFSSGHSGTRVLLVEPFRDGELPDTQLRGQPCIVKLGPRSLLEDEQGRYLHWVRELLPMNAARLDGFARWNDRAALRFSLIGDTSRGEIAAMLHGQMREAREWLSTAPPFDAHLFLERVFVGDLATCWYTNSPRVQGPAPMADIYSRMVPCLVHLVDGTPPRGLIARADDRSPTNARGAHLPLEGLRPTPARSFHVGDEVTLGPARVLGFRPVGELWEYELACESPALRFTVRTALSPELIEPDGIPSRLVSGHAGDGGWSVRGRVEGTAFDRFQQALRRCCNVYSQTHPGESVSITEGGEFLLVQTAELSQRLPSPLEHLARLLGERLSCNWSLIHGDLHGRNVLVSPQGQPFYIDFARTGYGPTLFDFIKFEVYLWHENFAGVSAPWATLSAALRLLQDLASADPSRHFPSPYARHGFAEPGAGLATFRQCLATLRTAARPHVVETDARDYFLPLALYTGLMLRWCDPAQATDPAEQKRIARQGVIHAVACASLLDGALGAPPERRSGWLLP